MAGAAGQSATPSMGGAAGSTQLLQELVARPALPTKRVTGSNGKVGSITMAKLGSRPT